MRLLKDKHSSFIAAAALAALALGCTPTNPDSGAGNSSTTTTTSNSSGGAKRPATTAPGNKITGDTILIGLVASQNGDLRPWGVDSVNGAQLAVDEVNKAGGINGKKVELRIGDSASKPEQGKSACEKLISDGVVGVLGEVASGITAQMAQAAYEKGIPDIAIGATRVDLTDIGNNVFRVCYTDDFQGPVMANFAYKELGRRNMALMTDKKQPYSTGLSASFRDTFTKLGGKIVDEQFYESGQTQFTAQLTQLKAKNPDGIFCSGYFNEVGPIARQTREAGMTNDAVKLLGGDGWDSSQILETGGEAIIGGYFCNHYNSQEKRPEVQDFLTKWKAKYPSNPVPATTMGALAYDAAMLMCDALKRAKTPDSQGLRDAIEDTENFKGVSGTITLKGNNGNPPKRAIVVELTKDGQRFAKAYEPSEVVR